MRLTGFTLIELLIVIAVLAIITSAGIVTYTGTRLTVNDSTRFRHMREMAIALERYYNDYSAYPAGQYETRNASWDTFSAFLEPEYMKDVPVDPKNNRGEGLMCGDCGEYFYNGSADGQRYILSTYLATGHANKTGTNIYGPYYSISQNCIPIDFWSC